MKVYKLTIEIIDFDNLSADEIALTLENTKYPNYCISPKVREIEDRNIEWSDDHLLNNKNTAQDEFKRLFS